MKDGTQKIPTNMLLGYDTDDDYNFVIIESEAKIVRTIFASFLKGAHPAEIAEHLNSLGVTTVLGNQWSAGSVKNILRNEKYCGDVLMQKTFTVNYLTHKTKKNTGEREQYYIRDHHTGIVPHEDWNEAQERLERIAGKRRKLRPKQQRLRPIQRGRLTGYIPINPIWTTLSHARLISATEKVLAKTHFNEIIMPVQKRSEESEDTTMAILEGFEVINLVESKGESVMTVSSTSLKFNKATAVELNYAPYIRMLVNASSQVVS